MVVTIVLELHFTLDDVFGLHLGDIFPSKQPKCSSKLRSTIGLEASNNIQALTLMEIRGGKLSKRGRQEAGHAGPAKALNVAEVDPWGVLTEKSHLHRLSWAFTSESETRHLAAMKIVLEQDLEELNEKTVTTIDGRTINVINAFPDVYGDLRMLRFLRKDTIQDPVTAAVRYRQFLRWRTENHVDQIRLQLDDRIRLGDKNAFLPPDDWRIVGECLPFRLHTTNTHNALVPVELELERWDIQKLTTNVLKGGERGLSLKEFFGYWIYIFEALNFHLYQESIQTKQLVFADIHCDVQGLKLRQFTPAFVSKILLPWILTAQSHYPETTKAIHFSRPSKLFYFVWMGLSSMFSKGTLAKVSIDGSPQIRFPDAPTSSSTPHNPSTFSEPGSSEVYCSA